MDRPGRGAIYSGMDIGIIGTGNMGRTLGLAWARAGHRVRLGSRDPSRARAIAATGPAGIETGDLDAAAAFGEVVLYTVRDLFPSRLLRRPEALAGKVLIDCNNSDLGGSSDPTQFRYDLGPALSLTQRLAEDAPQARVVKAFNTVPHVVIARGREALAPHRVSVFICGEDRGARAVVAGLCEALGLVGVDSGGLANAPLLDAMADFVRFQIVAMGLGPYASFSLRVLPGKE
jgi:predicted dinucleotide-binding enzyme